MTDLVLAVHHIQWFDEPTLGAEGMVWYTVQPRGNQDETKVMFLVQRFAKGPIRDHIHEGGGRTIIWGWNGNREAPTLTPSYRSQFHFHYDDGLQEVMVHLFLKKGKIQLCGDSTVTLEDGA